MYNKAFEATPIEERTAICKYFIRKLFLFECPEAEGIEASLFFKKAMIAGVYNGGYGEPISDAILEMCDVVSHQNEENEYLYTTFVLKEDFR